MTSDNGNSRGAGTPVNTLQGAPNVLPYMAAAPTGLPDNTGVAHTAAYCDTGLASVVDQFAGLGIGTGLPALSGYSNAPMMQHNGSGLSYAPPLYTVPPHAGGQIMPGSNGTVWIQNGIKWPLLEAHRPDDLIALHPHLGQWPKPQRDQLLKYYESLGAFGQDVPPLENRRSSYSTTESTPATPFYGSTASRDAGSRVTVFDRGSSAYTTPSPPQVTSSGFVAQPKVFTSVPAVTLDRDLQQILSRDPAIPQAVPAVFTPRENMKTLEQSLVNHIPGNRNVYIRGLHPTTDDDLLLKYAERFGPVETSKAIIDTNTGACKGFGFAKFKSLKDSEACIRGFYAMGYEVGFARVESLYTLPSNPLLLNPLDPMFLASGHASASDSGARTPTQAFPILLPSQARAVKMCGCHCPMHTSMFTNFDPWDQESFNSRLKAEGDEKSTNLYISNLPKSVTETDLSTIFVNFPILSAKILRDSLGNSRGVGFARFESREECDQIIEMYTGQPLGDEGLPMQIRYADTPAQKELKRITSERRQFRTNEYNVGAYGTPLVGMSPTIYSQSGWKQRGNSNGSTPFPRSSFVTVNDDKLGTDILSSDNATSGDNPTSEDDSADEGVTIHIESPLVANGSTRSSPVKDKD